MNSEFEKIKSILSKLRSEYMSGCKKADIDPNIPITERDIVAEIYGRLRKEFLKHNNLAVHCEVKPAPNVNASTDVLKGLPRIDVAILSDKGNRTWISEAEILQAKYKKGDIEARFSSIPYEFFHTAIEVKIQSNVKDAKRDIDILKQLYVSSKSACNCFFVLLNARGSRRDHDAIKEYGDGENICVIEYTRG